MSTPVVSASMAVSSLYIPPELLDKILSFCRPSTLAVASRVSSACLELASPWLYTDIVVRDLESIVKLFRLSVSADRSFGLNHEPAGRCLNEADRLSGQHETELTCRLPPLSSVRLSPLPVTPSQSRTE